MFDILLAVPMTTVSAISSLSSWFCPCIVLGIYLIVLGKNMRHHADTYLFTIASNTQVNMADIANAIRHHHVILAIKYLAFGLSVVAFASATYIPNDDMLFRIILMCAVPFALIAVYQFGKSVNKHSNIDH